MSVRDAEWPVGSARSGSARGLAPALRRLGSGTAAMVQAELRKLRHDHLDILTRSVQPLLWLFVFGTALHRSRALTVGNVDYRAYLAPGVICQAALFIAIFYGLGVIWERDVGQLQRLLATPLPRAAIVLGKAAGASTRAIAQAIVFFLVLAITRIDLDWNVLRLVAALLVIVLGTAGFACLSMLLASLVHNRERFMGIGQLIMMPLFFASSALYPLAIIPPWLRLIARVNPLTYEVHALRYLLLDLPTGGTFWIDIVVLIGFLLVSLAGATRAYPKAIL